MSDISLHVGSRIKKYRKSKGLTIEQLGLIINKSKATISKYENGSVAIDLDTLHSIATALNVNIMSLMDYNVWEENTPENINSTYFDRSNIYLYYYDGRTDKIVKTLICKIPAENKTKSDPIKVIMYQGIDSFETIERAQHIFVGDMIPYDTITHFILTNQVNHTEKMYICIFNPLHANSRAIGMLSGIASNPFFGPVALKVLASNEILEESDDLLNVIKLQALDHQILESLNMLFINRPNALFLKAAIEKVSELPSALVENY